MSVGTGPAGDQAAVREFIARLDRTLAASSARVELRYGGEDLVPPSHLLPPEDHDPGRVERLVTSAARLAWKHAVPDKWREWWREMEASLVTAGFAEPVAGRYQVSNGKSATVCTGGQHYTGSPGQPLPEGRQDAAAPRYRDPLAWLRLLPGVTEARYAGEETLRGTPCRKILLSKVLRELRPAGTVSQEDEKEDNPAEFTAWIDGHHVRQLETDASFAGNRSWGTQILELWDFGVPVDSLDWTRFPAGPVLGALVLFGLQEALSSQGAWYLVIVGGLAVIATLVASRGLWGLASDRFGWSLLRWLPGASPARLIAYHPAG